jgi:protein-S-isoprenylcysteine O-methyltransferase Ste14
VRRLPATIVSVIWLVIAPGTVSGLLPWWLTGWRGRGLGSWWLPLQVLGFALIAAGVAVLLQAFARFAREGRGTPVPVAAPEQLVVGGLYRHVRNPMYVAVVAVIVGQVLVLARFELLWYAGLVAAVSAAFVHLYEEPALRRRFGTGYDEYRRGVPAWLPRMHAWQPPGHP